MSLGTPNINTTTVPGSTLRSLSFFLHPPWLAVFLPLSSKDIFSFFCVHSGSGKRSSYWDFPILVLAQGLVSFSYFACAPHQIVSPTRARSLEPSSTPLTQAPHVCVRRSAWWPSWRCPAAVLVTFLQEGHFFRARFKDGLHNTMSYSHVGMLRTSLSPSYVRFTMGSYPTGAPV